MQEYMRSQQQENNSPSPAPSEKKTTSAQKQESQVFQRTPFMSSHLKFYSKCLLLW